MNATDPLYFWALAYVARGAYAKQLAITARGTGCVPPCKLCHRQARNHARWIVLQHLEGGR